jgi:hypothetical protein
MLEVCEGTLHCGANSVLLPIPFLLPGSEKRATAAALVEDAVIRSGSPALPFQAVVGVPLVAEDRALVAREKVCALCGVVSGCGGEPERAG